MKPSALLPEPALHDAIVWLRRRGFAVAPRAGAPRRHLVRFPADDAARELSSRRLLVLAGQRGWVRP
jgi:hypothetical protein